MTHRMPARLAAPALVDDLIKVVILLKMENLARVPLEMGASTGVWLKLRMLTNVAIGGKAELLTKTTEKLTTKHPGQLKQVEFGAFDCDYSVILEIPSI